MALTTPIQTYLKDICHTMETALINRAVTRAWSGTYPRLGYSWLGSVLGPVERPKRKRLMWAHALSCPPFTLGPAPATPGGSRTGSAPVLSLSLGCRASTNRTGLYPALLTFSVPLSSTPWAIQPQIYLRGRLSWNLTEPWGAIVSFEMFNGQSRFWGKKENKKVS